MSPSPSLWYCPRCEELKPPSFLCPHCGIPLERTSDLQVTVPDVLIPRAELEGLIHELALCNESFGCFEKHKHLIAKFRAKYLE